MPPLIPVAEWKPGNPRRGLRTLSTCIAVLASAYGCPASTPVRNLLLQEIEVWSDPEGANVYFVPELEFTEQMVNDPGFLGRYRVQEGPTNVKTLRLEQTYAVVFELGDRREILRNVRVTHGYSNRVGVRFSVSTESTDETPSPR